MTFLSHPRFDLLIKPKDSLKVVRKAKRKAKATAITGAMLLCLLPAVTAARISAPCGNCHVNANQTKAPDGATLIYDCVSCHAQGAGEKIVTMAGGIEVPQVFHTDPSGDLAAGNFAYIAGLKRGVGAPGSRKGHNVVDLGAPDDFFSVPPGFRHAKDHPEYFRAENLTCAGVNGCHGVRNQLFGEDDDRQGKPKVGLAAIHGAHHANVDGKLDDADTVADSYRFLLGVKGLENPDPSARWQNVSAYSHNEYYGVISEPYGGEKPNACSRCHVNSETATADSFITSPNNTISGFCRTCHSTMHSRPDGGPRPFLRHPADYVIKNDGELAAYTTYNITAPVARPNVPSQAGSTVTPGTDVVMCLSCHMAHASPYDSLLRFDYTKMVAGRGNGGTGCLVCHSAKGR
jgi:predicted CXXCH cytochrome family protein